MQSERELVQKILAGDSRAFRLLLEDYQALVCHVVFRMIQNDADREEICQDVFMKVYQNLKTFEFQSKLSTWIGKIAYNTSLNYMRKKKTLLYEDLLSKNIETRDAPEDVLSAAGKPPDASFTDEPITREEFQRSMHQMISQLPFNLRIVLTLYHLDDMSYRDISEITGQPEGTVKSNLFRARKLLKDKIEQGDLAENLNVNTL